MLNLVILLRILFVQSIDLEIVIFGNQIVKVYIMKHKQFIKNLLLLDAQLNFD